MTDQADQEVIQMADEIRQKRAKDTKLEHEAEAKKFMISKENRFYKECFTGAHNEAFKVIHVGRDGWGDDSRDTMEVMFAHSGHYGISKGSINYDDHLVYQFNSNFIEEITEIDFLVYVNKFLKLTGLHKMMNEETNH